MSAMSGLGKRGRRAAPLHRPSIEAIYRSEAPHIARYFRARLHDSQDALDLVHDAFVRLASTGVTGGCNRPAAYLQSIARNLLIDRSRTQRARRMSDHLPLDDHPDLAIGPDQTHEIEREDVMRLYRRALSDMPDRTRTIFTLHRVDELTYSEIARRLEISIPTVQYHVARGLAHIDRVLNFE